MDKCRKRKRERSSESPTYLGLTGKLSLHNISNSIKSRNGEAIQVIYSLYPNTNITFETMNLNSTPPSFASILTLKGFGFYGYGHSKRESRAAACKVALSYLLPGIHDLCHVDWLPIQGELSESGNHCSTESDILAARVYSKYEQIRNDPKISRVCTPCPWFKMIGGVVMVRNRNYTEAEVVALSTGSKCIDPRNMKYDGSVVIDSHAEILVRRAFQYYLYKSLQCSNETSNSIFEFTESKYCLKQDISFHLYISSAPCGDSRIFATSDEFHTGDRHPNRVSRGVLRMKLDGGNSTVPVGNDKYALDTRLKIMSCSDKLLRSNVLGAQGALLNNLAEPVFFESVVVSDLYDNQHLTRALYGRISETTFQLPFRLNQIRIQPATSQFLAASNKSPKTCINWIAGEPVEILNSTTGKTTSSGVSRLSKLQLMKQYLSLVEKNQNLQITISNYNMLKSMNVDYQNAKNKFYKLLKDKGLGVWIQRIHSE